MLQMNIDLSGLAEIKDDMEPDWQYLQQGLVNAAQYLRDVWRAAVTGTVLPGMTGPVHDDKYAAALQTGSSIQTPEPLHAIVLPVNYDDGVDSVEQGVSPFDMKTQQKTVNGEVRGGLLTGPKARQSKSGSTYNIIPFRHYVPTSSDGGQSAMSIKLQMPNEIYKQAKTLTRSVQDPSTGSMAWGQSLKLDPIEWPAAQSFTGYVHKSSIYEGMVKTGAPRHTTYQTFRTVSTNSDPASWWHPAVPGNPVIQAVYDYCMPQIEKQLQEVASKAFGM